MRFEQLQYLEAALHAGSFRQAAKDLGVSQPTITNQVQRLEEDLGVLLVVRGSHGVSATYAAERILPHAAVATRAERLLRQEVSAIDSLKIGHVRVASVATGSQTVLPEVVKRMHVEHPNIRFEATEGGSDMVRQGVVTGHFDVGLVTRLGLDEEDIEQLHFIELLKGRLVLAVPEDHPLADKDVLDTADLDGEPLIFYKEGSILRRAFEKLVEGVESRVVYSTDGAETTQRMVRAGVGIAMANTLAPSTASGNGVALVPIPFNWTRTTLSAVVREGQLRSPAVQTFLRLARETPAAREQQRP